MNKAANYTQIGSSFDLIPVSLSCKLINRKEYKDMDEQTMQLTAKLAEITVRNTASAVIEKIKTVKAKKNDQETIAELTEIIQDLIDDKQNLVLISKGLENELVSQKLTDEDVKSISDTILPIIIKFAEASDDGGQLVENINLIKPLISKEMLTIMQLLGFNYKKAIGEPLTQLLNNKIKSFEIKENDELQLAVVQRDTEYYKLMQNEKAIQNIKDFKQ
ncbi:hypothetical protein G6R29_01815 [Fructobacillus sp. M2-14]|uniref:Uncharacterized protein n=1 Tax=Fructobacillus broussonetiae TaxID=2713173 RepID=A0ABS5R044_9LACO|nr:hypothetical protein [Fructobacillus broussonetiae]MBS9338372.1 hypothetical protein [Fructobacillus broussonetiae]